MTDKLVIPKNFTETALILPKEMSLEEWHDYGKGLALMQNSVLWWWGDWWAYGERQYGKGAEIAEQSPHSYQVLANAGYVSRQIEFSRRREKLPWSYHFEVASLDPPDQDELLDAAIAEDWSRGFLRCEVRRRKLEKTQKDPGALPKRLYRVIYADPPWPYAPGIEKYGPAQRHYPVMSIDALCSLSVEDLSDTNAVLFLWTTTAFLPDSFDVIRAWGFEYKTSFVWDKVKHNYGRYNSVRHEFLLVATKGSCTPDVRQLFDSVQTIERTKHSEKPEKFREIIDTLYPTGGRIELFARKRGPGKWETWGNE